MAEPSAHVVDEVLERLKGVSNAGVSPKQFYPFNEETERIYQAWKKARGG